MEKRHVYGGGKGVNSRQRDPNTVGQIYQIPKNKTVEQMEYINGRYSFDRLRPGDLLLCLKHSGDCHYNWGLVETNTTNQDWHYCDITKVFIGYSMPEEWAILDTPLTYKQMVSALISMSNSNSTGILISLSKKEHEKLQQRIGPPAPTPKFFGSADIGGVEFFEECEKR